MTDSIEPELDGQIRETYEEYVLEDRRVGLIADPENGDAWIQSDLTCPVEL